jgi:hypothetical protein
MHANIHHVDKPHTSLTVDRGKVWTRLPGELPQQTSV